jgi:hypothetical protein
MQIRDPGKKKSDPGSTINIPDPQHWCFGSALVAIQVRIQEANRIRRIQILIIFCLQAESLFFTLLLFFIWYLITNRV